MTTCDNFVMITCPDGIQLIKATLGEHMDFNQLRPFPDKLGSQEGFDWAVTYWGTPYNAINDVGGTWEFDNDDPTTIWINFETTYTPCLPVMRLLARKFPHARVMYVYAHEEDGYCGCRVWEGGKQTYRKHMSNWSYDEHGSAGENVEPQCQ